MKKSAFDDTERITHHLMLNAYFIPDIGFFRGQMGLVLAMSEYSRYANNEIYFDVSSYLLDNIMEKINENLIFSFASGLSGIGWGVEYLIQNGFVEGEGVEICEEIDQKIMKTDPRRIADMSLDTGFEGILHYVVYHLQGAFKQNIRLPFDERYLSDLYAVCILLKEQKNDINMLLDIYIDFYTTRTIKGYNMLITDFVTAESTGLSEKLSSYPLGLKDGLAGKLLKIIFAK